MRKIITSILLVTSLFALTACSGNRYMREKALANEKLESDLKAIEDIHKALAAIGVDVGDTEDSYATASVQLEEVEDPESYDERGKAPYGGRYTEISRDIYIDMHNNEKLVGKYYYTPGKVEDIRTFDNGIEYMVLGVEWGFVAIAKISVEQGWRQIKVGDIVTAYFRYIDYLGYDEYLEPFGDMPLGSYEYFEDYND